MRSVDIAIAFSTFLIGMFVSGTMLAYFIRVYKKTSASHFQWLLLSVSIAKFAIAGWAATNAYNMAILGGPHQPSITLPWRVMILLALLINFVLIYRFTRTARAATHQPRQR